MIMVKFKDLEIKGKVFLAPMAGVTNFAFRKLCQRLGADVTYTEMVSNLGLKYNSFKTKELAYVAPDECIVGLQIFGGQVEDYVTAAKYYDQTSGAKIIDINLGCPVNKVAIKSQAGSSLLKTPEKIKEIIQAITKEISKPLTIKIRLGWDQNSLTHIEVAKIAQAAGASAITIHGRTRAQLYTGKADWKAIKAVKDIVQIPVIGNGDVKTPEDAKKMFDQTGVDAIMIARQARENPWIFKQIKQYLATGKYDPLPDLATVAQTLKEYLLEVEKIKPEKVAILHVRGMAAHWLKRFKDHNQQKQAILMAKDKIEFHQALNKFVNLSW